MGLYLPPPPNINLLKPPPRPPSRTYLPDDVCPSLATTGSSVLISTEAEDVTSSSFNPTSSPLSTPNPNLSDIGDGIITSHDSSLITSYHDDTGYGSAAINATNFTSAYNGHITSTPASSATSATLTNNGVNEASTLSSGSIANPDVTNPNIPNIPDGGLVPTLSTNHGAGLLTTPYTNQSNSSIPPSSNRTNYTTLEPDHQPTVLITDLGDDITTLKGNQTAGPHGKSAGSIDNDLADEEIIIICGSAITLILIIILIWLFLWMRKPRLRVKPTCTTSEVLATDGEINFLYNYQKLGRRWSDKVQQSSTHHPRVIFTSDTSTTLAKLRTPSSNHLMDPRLPAGNHARVEFQNVSPVRKNDDYVEFNEVEALAASQEFKKEMMKGATNGDGPTLPDDTKYEQKQSKGLRGVKQKSNYLPKLGASKNLLKAVKTEQQRPPKRSGEEPFEGYLETDGAEIGIKKGKAFIITQSAPREEVYSPEVKDILQTHLNQVSSSRAEPLYRPLQTHTARIILGPEPTEPRSPKKNKTRWEKRRKSNPASGYSSREESDSKDIYKVDIPDSDVSSNTGSTQNLISPNTVTRKPDASARSRRRESPDRSQRQVISPRGQSRPRDRSRDNIRTRDKSPRKHKDDVRGNKDVLHSPSKNSHSKHTTVPAFHMQPMKIASALEYSKLVHQSSQEDSSSNTSGNDATAMNELKPILRKNPSHKNSTSPIRIMETTK